MKGKQFGFKDTDPNEINQQVTVLSEIDLY